MKIKRIPAGIYEANCYILIDEKTKEVAVIDPGGDGEILIKEIDKLDVKVNCILLTHGHMDHTDAVQDIKDKYNVPVYINPKDKEMMSAGENVFGAIWEQKNDGTIEDGDTLKLGELIIKCIETAGHTPGGMCFLVENVVFTGDTLFQGSIGRTDFVGGSYELLIKNIKTKLMILPEDTIVLPGHGPESSIKYEKQNNPFL
ncbi:MBL fold metallo-hydrolase [Clostridium ganghwense]|uniref:MBL fold metallo-hydrolase n=1 Tax=Clostridium ganghwense TaxID=312089 RepID=A0ABT4CR32_9CLOT|nr:MBL fold metallo-hydrolase [Clostridium ganghwense]MCY6370454.1 MBL fold metallo-hydrolase [Clostridium ganghwense]